MDRTCYVAPARVRVLVVPVAGCTGANYARYLAFLRSANDVRLLDVSPIPDSRYFNPQTFPAGRVMYDFGLALPGEESIFLHDFEPFRKTFVVLGVGSYTEDFHDPVAALKKEYPASIIHSCIVFDTPDDTIAQLRPKSDHLPKLTFYHDGSTSQNITALDTILCDVTCQLLSALDHYASSYLNITLRSPVSITDSHMLAKTIHQAQKRLSSGSSSFKVSFSSSPTPAPSPVDVKSKTQLRHTGRQSKLMGNFLLLAGKYTEALQYFSDAVINLKKSDDCLWLGSALEGLGVSVVLLQYVDVPYQLQNPALLAVLLVTKSKLNAISGDTAKRVSSDTALATATNGTNGHTRQGSNVTNNSLTAATSPRNSSGSFMSFNFPQATNGAPDLNLLPLSEFVKLITYKANQFYYLSTSDYENTVPDLVYVESILRSIKFMLTVYLGGDHDLNVEALECIVKGTNLLKVAPGRNKSFLKSDILKEVDKIFSLQLIDMSFFEQCRIYCALATVYSDLGLQRKKAFILRILLVSLLPKFETRIHESNVAEILGSNSLRDIFGFLFAAYGIGIEPESSATSADHHSSDWMSLQLLLLMVSLRICEAVKDYHMLLKLCTIMLTRYTHCLTADDQIKLKDKVDWLIYLSNRNNLNLVAPYWDPFLVRSARFISNRNKDDLIPFAEYEKSSNSVVGLVDSAKKGTPGSKEAKENSPFIFNPYEKQNVNTINKDRLLIKNEVYHLKLTLQNPFAFEIEIAKVAIVTEGEVSVQALKHLMRLLPNSSPNSLSPQPQTLTPVGLLRTSLVNKVRPSATAKDATANFQSQVAHNSAHAITIGPNSTQTVLIAFKPLSPGDLEIVGFDIIVVGCKSQFFQIVDKELINGSFRIKDIGKIDLNSSKEIFDKVFTNLSENIIDGRALTKTLKLNVVPPQPSLSLTDLLISNGWLMLLEGEKYEFSIRLTNHSEEPINYLSFSFWDSTIEPLNNKLNSNPTGTISALPASEIYEIEWYLLKFKPFMILNKEEIASKYKLISPQGDVKIDYQITGKRGMRELKIILEYAHKITEELSQSFVKNIHVPLKLSVVPSFDVVGCDIVPLFASSLDGFDHQRMSPTNDVLLHNNLDRILTFMTLIIESKVENISDYCLLIIDIRNAWSEKLQCNLSYRISDDTNFGVQEVIDPSVTVRFLLPVKRISGQEIDTTRPIPSLRNKQFIKNYNISAEDDLKMRNVFWLRHRLLENISGSWQSVSGDEHRRLGTIELRTIRITQKMANVLIYPEIGIDHKLVNDANPSEVVKRTGTFFNLEIEKFYSLVTTVTNHSDQAITGILRHLPFPMATNFTNQLVNPVHYKSPASIDRKILINGVLQNHIGDRQIQPKESFDITLSFMVLEKGEYEWASVFQVLNSPKLTAAGREPIFLSAQ